MKPHKFYGDFYDGVMSTAEFEAYQARKPVHYATELTGIVDACELCGNETNEPCGLCPHCEEWANREPCPGYDRSRFAGYDGWRG